MLILSLCSLTTLTSVNAQESRAWCPRNAKQSDVLGFRLLALPTAKMTNAVRQAMVRVYACHPAHPIFGGSALIRFEGAYKAPGSHFILRFSVKGLSDMYLAYLMDREGNLMQAFVTGP